MHEDKRKVRKVNENIIFTSFIIKKICLLSSVKTNDLANHININTTMEHNFNFKWSFPNSNTSIFLHTHHVLVLNRTNKQNLETFNQYSFRNWGAPDRNVLAFFKDKLNSSQRFEIQTWWFQASVMKEMRSVLFWYVTQCTVVIPYQRFRATYPSHLQGARILQDGTDRLFRKIVKELALCAV